MNSNDIAGMCACVMVLGIPIIAILTSHQRKMAMILHGRQDSSMNAEAQALRHEIRELKGMVHQQAIALDNLARPLPSDARLQDRVG